MSEEEGKSTCSDILRVKLAFELCSRIKSVHNDDRVQEIEALKKPLSLSLRALSTLDLLRRVSGQ